MEDKNDIFHSKQIRTLKWFLWKACWPSVVVLMFYPLYFLIVHSQQPFAEAFGEGDFLLLSFVLLIETALASEHLRHSKKWLEAVRHLAILFALIFTILFAWTKFDIVVLLPDQTEIERTARLVLYAQVNCYAIIVAVLMGLIAFYSACDIEDELALEQAAA